MANRFGFDAYIGCGVETAWGTAVARTRFAEISAESGGLNPGRTEIPSWRTRVRTGHVDMGAKVAKSYTVPLRYDFLATYFRNLMWGYSGSITAGRTTHIFTLGTTQPASLTIEGANSEANAEVDAGCFLRRGQWDFKSDGFPSFGFDYLGIPGTPAAKTTFGTDLNNLNANIIKPAQVVFSDGTAYADCDSIQFSVDAGLSDGALKFGSPNIVKPLPTGKATVQGQITRYYSDATMQSRYSDGTNVSISVTATGPAFSGGFYSLTALFNNASIEGDPITHQNAGVVEETIKWIAEHDATNTAMKLTLVNSEPILT